MKCLLHLSFPKHALANTVFSAAAKCAMNVLEQLSSCGTSDADCACENLNKMVDCIKSVGCSQDFIAGNEDLSKGLDACEAYTGPVEAAEAAEDGAPPAEDDEEAVTVKPEDDDELVEDGEGQETSPTEQQAPSQTEENDGPATSTEDSGAGRVGVSVGLAGAVLAFMAMF